MAFVFLRCLMSDLLDHRHEVDLSEQGPSSHGRRNQGPKSASFGDHARLELGS